MKLLARTDKESFKGAFALWSQRWCEFLKERAIYHTGKNRDQHKRVISTYLSLKHNMPYLWTWYDHDEVGIPNTNEK